MSRFQIPTNPVHYVDSGSDVNSATDYRVNVSAPGSKGAPTINFSIMSGNWGKGTGTNVQETALATLTPVGPVLNYTVTATASPKIPSIQITPQIWKKATAGDTLVYTGPVVTCSPAAQCIASGNFTPPDAATYYTNASVLYTLPATTADGVTVEPQQNVIAATSGGTIGGITQALDVAGRSLSSSDVGYAKLYQQDMGYNPTVFYSSTMANQITPKLSDNANAIFFFSGHGGPGIIDLNDSSLSLNRIYAQKETDSFDKASASYSNMKLAVFLGCDTGNTDTSRNGGGNLVNVVTSKSASCAMGWTDLIVDTATDPWSNNFWTSLYNGKTIMQAHNDGLNAVKSLYACTQQPYSPYCNLDKLYSQGSGCSQILPVLTVKKIPSKELEINLPTASQILLEREAIIAFSGDKTLNPVFLNTISYSYGLVDFFDTNTATYSIERNTSQIQFMTNSMNIPTPPEANTISRDQGYPIAETYARTKAPEIWSNSPGVAMIITSTNGTDLNNGWSYSWTQYYVLPPSPSNQSLEIQGMNLVRVTLDPHDGSISSYSKWYLPLDSQLNLTPDLTEEQAWSYAKEFYESNGIEVTDNVNKTAYGLSITPDENNNQHLTWKFYVDTTVNGIAEGGLVGIDAHDGSVVWKAMIA